MALFNWSKKTTVEQEPTAKPQLDLTKKEAVELLDLRKSIVTTTCTELNELKGIQSRVALVLDYSGSMSELYRNGTVQSIVDRILPIACQFDDNQALDLWIFENGYHRLGEITEQNFFGFVKSDIVSKYRMGGTNYAPVMQDVLTYYLKDSPSNEPIYVIFITDGDNGDKRATTSVIQTASKEPIFWQFVGIGNSNFPFLEQLDDMKGRFLDNAGFFQLNDIQKVEDKELYRRLLTEYPSWLTQAKKKNLY